MTTGSFIPVLDLAPAREGNVTLLGQQIHEAFVTSGFCYVKNHGIKDDYIKKIQKESMSFFHLPLSEKDRYRPKQAVRGFNALNRTIMYGAEKPDYKEFYQIGPEFLPDGLKEPPQNELQGVNVWPEDRPAFRQAFLDYYQAAAECGQLLLKAVASSLNLSPDFFKKKYHYPLQRTQTIWYPPAEMPSVSESITYGVAPHTDYGCITLLWQDDTGGLEVQNLQNEWVPAAPIPGTLVINIGDLLCRWSNNRYRSNMHRVLNKSGKERFSIATFYDPDFDAVIDPRDLGLPDPEVSHYEPVTAGAYIMGRIRDSQQKKKP
ncbi:oxidoreductase [Acetobacter tropicalis]|uniref:2-oxoglutarate-dependent ethylene/succinate-forming enzyme n=1 Tax=Acetobacter tropicalis TaxID=104102 RepID=A0A149U1V2_9PROT|nr:2OG-Fe(II) oxygenase family protein [Acetobacter tropicalis]KXV59433.1 oxidoreductase [Acetobacter tropicalis]